MIFKIKDLRTLLLSLDKRKIDQIALKSNNFELLINKTYQKKMNANIKINNIKKIHNESKKNLTPIQTQKIQNISKTINDINTQDSEIYSTIISPMVGTFYRSPGPNETAFVKTFDIVEKKQIVCIIEAMKLMNEIEAEIHGEIVEILVQDGEIVDCGQGLMKVKKIHKS
uniref:Biotin carboxyl carrier protein of acetyl-CoA carboxylase n=1 Tax=Crouania attenuata TaxID=42002 RepID=A0A4D6WPR3_9FLOR|nr:acetyl-CoA carboxylase, biotin carboxyl carrier protein [Crouania attenuata]